MRVFLSLKRFGPSPPLESNDSSLFLLLMALFSLLKPLVQSICPLFCKVFAVLKREVNANA